MWDHLQHKLILVSKNRIFRDFIFLMTFIMPFFLSQVQTSALKAANAVNGRTCFRHLNPCVNKSGPIHTFTPLTPNPPAAACSSGSLERIPTKRWQSIIWTTPRRARDFPQWRCSFWLSRLCLEWTARKILFCFTLSKTNKVVWKAFLALNFLKISKCGNLLK